MDHDAARRYLLGLPESLEDFPFGPDVAVFKIRGRMFATLGIAAGLARVNLKCDPLEAQFLRDMFAAVRPGYHMNKTHWNTVLLDGSIARGEIERMIDRSYDLVVRKLAKAERIALETLYGPARIYR
jgi:predicted DNA-binding protein (MmcQ/YjbR family)